MYCIFSVLSPYVYELLHQITDYATAGKPTLIVLNSGRSSSKPITLVLAAHRKTELKIISLQPRSSASNEHHDSSSSCYKTKAEPLKHMRLALCRVLLDGAQNFRSHRTRETCFSVGGFAGRTMPNM